MDIEEVKRKVTPIFKQYGVLQASVFGSVARGEAKADSDVDLVVRVGKLPFGIWSFVGLRNDLEKALQKKVDVISDASINPILEKKIKNDLTKIYERP